MCEFKFKKYFEETVITRGGIVNAHAHLDRADTLTKETVKYVNAPLQVKWDLVDDMKRSSTEDDYLFRMISVVERLKAQGVSAIGSFIDIDEVVGYKALNAARRLEWIFPDIVFIFMHQPLKGIVGEREREWFYRAAEEVDILGALPARDKGREDEYHEILFSEAKRLGKRVHTHVDQLNSADETETEQLVGYIKKYQMEGMVTAIHGISIAAQDYQYRHDLYQKIAEVDLSFISCPTAWIDHRRNETLSPSHNSVTPVDEMLEYGIKVAIGTDNINDIYCPGNDGIMWEDVALLTRTNRLFGRFDDVVDIATKNGREVLGLETHQHSTKNLSHSKV